MKHDSPKQSENPPCSVPPFQVKALLAKVEDPTLPEHVRRAARCVLERSPEYRETLREDARMRYVDAKQTALARYRALCDAALAEYREACARAAAAYRLEKARWR